MCNSAVYEFAERRQGCRRQQQSFLCEDDPCLTSQRIQTSTVCTRRLEFASLRQDPLDLSFWSFLTFLHHGIAEIETHFL